MSCSGTAFYVKGWRDGWKDIEPVDRTGWPSRRHPGLSFVNEGPGTWVIVGLVINSGLRFRMSGGGAKNGPINVDDNTKRKVRVIADPWTRSPLLKAFHSVLN